MTRSKPIQQFCQCGHAREDHDHSFPKCAGWDDDYLMPIVAPGQPYQELPKCACKQFAPMEWIVAENSGDGIVLESPGRKRRRLVERPSKMPRASFVDWLRPEMTVTDSALREILKRWL